MKKLFALVLLFSLALASPLVAGSVQIMDKDELKSLLGSDKLVVLDVRTGRDWSTSEFIVQDAVRVEGKDLSVTEKYPKDNTFVFYCAWPNEYTSARLAQKLVDKGYENVYALKGGWRDWYRNKYPVSEK